MTTLAISDLTQATLDGTGLFDTLMRANKAHLEAEFAKGRIKGPEYATVYLGSLQTVLGTALSFLLQKDKAGLEAELLSQQIALATVEVQKANAELAILQASLAKTTAEVAQLTAQTALATSQKAQVEQQTANLVLEAVNIPKQGAVLDAQHCKLTAEYDLTVQTTQKTVQETTLLLQKIATEKAQTIATGVDADSVLGKQKGLYQAQSDGFKRDAEQKAAKILVDTWNVRRTTDDATVADSNNLLNDVTIGRTISKLLTGVGA